MLWKGFCTILHFQEILVLMLNLCFTLEYQIVVLICYAFHIVLYCCSLYHFNHLVAFEINICLSIYLSIYLFLLRFCHLYNILGGISSIKLK